LKKEKTHCDSSIETICTYSLDPSFIALGGANGSISICEIKKKNQENDYVFE